MTKEEFDQQLKVLSDLYEEGKDCLVDLDTLVKTTPDDRAASHNRLVYILREMRDMAAVAMKKNVKRADPLLDENGWYTIEGAHHAATSRLKKNEQGEYELVKSDKKWVVVVPYPISTILGEKKAGELHELIDVLLQHEVMPAISVSPYEPDQKECGSA